MPNLTFQIKGVEAVAQGMTPLLHFDLHIRNPQEDQPIHALLLSAQIQFQCPLRAYSETEKEKLTDLFGTPERWGQTLRNRFWTHSHTTVGSFTGSTKSVLAVPCTYDLNVAAAKYLYALEAGEVSLLFLFSGSVFYSAPSGQLQVERISWSKECSYRFPITVWRDLMERHYPNSAWLYLRRDTFDRIYAFKRDRGLPTWDRAVELLLDQAEEEIGSARPALACPDSQVAP
jgi:hypothetical protein